MLSDWEKNKRKRTKRERNQRVVDLYTSGRGLTMKEVGQMCGGISKQRVSIILQNYNVEPEYIRKRRLKEKHLTIECRSCGKKFSVPPSEKKLHCGNECRVKYTDEDLREELAAIIEEHGELTYPLIRDEATPAYSTFKSRIGTLEDMRNFVEGEEDE